MSNVIQNYQSIKSSINNSNVNIIAVTKNFTFDKIKPLFDLGHDHFGENKVQEAKAKWSNIRQLNPNLKLHMIGKLQTNKAKEAVELFDFIHSVDNEKLVNTLSNHEDLIKKKNKYFIQVNIGNENQKSGINKDYLENFLAFCLKKSLNVVGLMCIPPIHENPKKYFNDLYELNNFLRLKELSMGMSADYMDAVRCGSTFVRIGSAIFGKRLIR